MIHAEVFSSAFLTGLVGTEAWSLVVYVVVLLMGITITKPNPLPAHLAERTHEDWPLPLRWVPRAWSAFGSRSGGAWRWLFPDRPRVILAWNCPRWMTPGDKSVLIIHSFEKAWLLPWMRQTAEGFETKAGHDSYLKNRRVALRYYGPSPIQSFDRTKSSFQITYPFHVAFHFQFFWKNEPRMVYGRFGFRWDSLDRYYNLGPYLGLSFE